MKKDIIERFSEMWNYWSDVAAHKEIGQENSAESTTFLKSMYNKITDINSESVLAQYLTKQIYQSELGDSNTLIFPFNFNRSQRKAIEKALTNSISIIEGPPGTGKTQTIINLISNLVGERKYTVAMVSATNEAVENVYEKMAEAGYGFLLAKLGKREKKDAFFQNLPSPDLNFLANPQNSGDVKDVRKLSLLFKKERKKAELEALLSSFELEFEHFKRYYEMKGYNEIANLSVSKLPPQEIINFLSETQMRNLRNKRNSIWFKFYLYIKYRFKEFSLMNNDELELVLAIQKSYYVSKISSLKEQIGTIATELENANFDQRKEEYQRLSRNVFNGMLFEKYSSLKPKKFSQDSYKKEFSEFILHYPVVLSTTYSILTSIPSDFLFDYLIIDESSQVDILSAVLALSCCKRVVIVGDTKQLPQIVDETIKEKLSTTCPDAAYDYFSHNILSSMYSVFGDRIPKTLLREHYRCEPAIIGFCNQRYYNNELIVLKKPKEETPLLLYQTVPGNHMRVEIQGNQKGKFNQRELDTILLEVLQAPGAIAIKDKKNIGFTTPYAKQSEKAKEVLPSDIECDTIHKYQGRQKEMMIMSTVVSNTREGKAGLRFVDDPCKINVAVSRAERQFVLVTDKTVFESYSKEIKALINYIRYQTLDRNIIESQVVSVFDLLYREYSKKLLEFSANLPTVSKYKSENIIYKLLEEILVQEEYTDLTVTFQVLLANLLNDYSLATEEELAYIKHRASVDFVIFDKMSKTPVLVIEVDGFAYHANNHVQKKRDELKNSILAKYNIPLLRLPTTGSQEKEKIRHALKSSLGI